MDMSNNVIMLIYDNWQITRINIQEQITPVNL